MSSMGTTGVAQTTWWVVLLRGIAAILFGILALLWPGLTLVILIALFAAYALVDGIANIVGALERRKRYDRWWVLLVEGIAGVMAGVLTFIWPAITALVLLFLIAARAVVGVLVFAFPAGGALAIVWLIAWYSLLAGVLLTILGFRLRSWSGSESRVA